MARKPKQQPATAYDYRRVKALVDVLALPNRVDRRKAIYHLCQQWQVSPIYVGMMDSTGLMFFEFDETVSALADHALEHARLQGGG